MTDIVCLHSKDDVERFCRRDPSRHLYALGDLDDFFWPHTTWYALRECDQVKQLVLIYSGCSMPVVLAIAEQPTSLMRDLLCALFPLLPKRFYAHFTENTVDVLASDYHVQSHGLFHKMALADRRRTAAVDGAEAVVLSATDIAELQALYAVSYPSHWFVPRMLETGCYYGIRRYGTLLSVAGVHVYSPAYKVAALGNITTRPETRGQGLATVVTARLCQELLRAGIDHIGLNVKADNRSAVACYERIGFERVADYGEYSLEPK